MPSVFLDGTDSPASIQRMVLSPDGSQLAVEYSFKSDPTNNVDSEAVVSSQNATAVRVIDLHRSGASLWMAGNRIECFVANNLLWVSNGNVSVVQNTYTGEITQKIFGRVLAINPQANASLLQGHSNEVRLFFRNGDKLAGGGYLPSKEFSVCSFSADGSRLLAAHKGTNILSIYDTSDGSLVLSKPHTDIKAIIPGINDDSVILVDQNGTVNRWPSRRSSEFYWKTPDSEGVYEKTIYFSPADFEHFEEGAACVFLAAARKAQAGANVWSHNGYRPTRQS